MKGAHSLCLELGAVACEHQGRVRQKVLQRGQNLFNAGQEFYAIFLVQSGSLKSYTVSVSGEEQIEKFHFQGDIVGMNAICQRTHPSSSSALENTRVCVLRYGPLLSNAAFSPCLQSALFGAMSEELLSMARSQTLLNRISAEQRVARFICDVIDRLRRWRGPVDDIQLPMSREEIGNYLGLASETVSRVMARLCERHILAVRGRRIRVLRYEALAASSETER